MTACRILQSLYFAAVFPSAAMSDGTGLEGLTWTEQKCVLYQQAWDWALGSVDASDVSEEFIAENTAFTQAGCIEDIPVCPQSIAELEMADMLTVMTMSEGMASTFVPFSCP